MSRPTLTLFDLDHTLLSIDSNQAWIAFLIDAGILDREHYTRCSAEMGRRYRAGIAGMEVEFCNFFASVLALRPRAELEALRRRFVVEVVAPSASDAARALVAGHRLAGDVLAIISATNRFVTAPIAEMFDIEHLIATELEMQDGEYTGRVIGLPSMREGKVLRLEAWLASGVLPGVRNLRDFARTRFYSDSINDLALMQAVDEAIAVDPDPQLRTVAFERGWSVLGLR